MKYRVTSRKIENVPLDPNSPNEISEYCRTYEATSKWNAIDEFLHDLFIDAKKAGFKIHHRDGNKEVAFYSKFSIYTHEDVVYTKYVVFDEITAKEITK